MINLRRINQFLFALTALAPCFVSSVNAQSNDNYAADPALTQPIQLAPKVMMGMSMDHQLFIKAYNDYDDLDNDGTPDVTYNPAYEYVGYFDYKLCYQYEETDGVGLFSPLGTTESDSSCNESASVGGWSGNFLNWVSMTRIDLIRHVLYGGYRAVDTNDETVLERTYLPQDGHSFAKYFEDEEELAKYIGDISDVAECSGATDGESCEGVTFCNTSRFPSTGTHFSQNINTSEYPPLLRVIKGNYSLWDSGERFQCLSRVEHRGGNAADNGDTANAPNVTNISAFGSAPADNTKIKDYQVRVRVCTDAQEGGEHYLCQGYPKNSVEGEESQGSTTVYKPYGLLHQYGAEGTVEFGLITGSYLSNKDGGVLRSGVGSFGEELNPNGTFKANDNVPPENTMIGNLDAFRIVDYKIDDGDNSGTYNDSGCVWARTDFDNGECRNWGNPFNEILAETYRYFSGTAGPMESVAEDSTLLDGLSVGDWPLVDDHDEDFACSRLSVLGFNASVTSYDDNLFYADDASKTINALLASNADGVAGDSNTHSAGGLDIDSLTNVVGDGTFGELPPGSYFVGNAAGNSNDECSAKTVGAGALSTIRGLCPEAPRLGGNYLSAGLAHYFHTQADTKISTFGVTMAGARPNISVKVSDSQTITLIPACKAYLTDENGDPAVGRCALVSFRAVGTPAATSGSYFVSWEDSEQGGDFDSDLLGMIEYDYDSATGKLAVDTTIIYESTGPRLEFGYIISGTQTDFDGAYYPSYVNAHDGFTSAGEDDCNGIDENAAAGSDEPVCSSAQHENDSSRFTQTVTFSVSSDNNASPGEFLEEPLYYASKWGSFDDKSIDSNSVPNTPDRDAEWKSADGEMLGYTSVSDPAQLRSKVGNIIQNLVDQPAVATATAASVSSATGVGFFVNSLYYPEIKDAQDRKITWVGSLTGLLRGRDGYLREDINDNNHVDAADPIVTFSKEAGVITAARNRISTSGALQELDGQTDLSLSSINYLWDVEASLRNLSQDTLHENREDYSNTADLGRYVLTGVKGANSLQVTGMTEFEASDSGLALFGDSLGISEEARVNLVNFIRGVEGIEGMRSRTLNGVRHLLGDTVNASPLVVGPPDKDYDISRSDTSYARFREKYKNRRNMVYLGANDGMLHAFNAGFPKTGSYIGSYLGPVEGPNAVTQHPLGSEVWSYVPYNLLPHLQWLALPEYRHVFYMDGDLQTFDVKIFENDEDNTYPGGWGTILVAGMRLGGGVYDIGDTEYRSAYVIFDITNPEQPPKLIAELTDEGMGYTTANVQLAVDYDVRSAKYEDTNGGEVSIGDALEGFNGGNFLEYNDATLGGLDGDLEAESDQDLTPSQLADTVRRITDRKNDWYLVFGSGPTDHRGAKSTQASKLYYVNLASLNALKDLAPDVPAPAVLQSTPINVSNSFVGGLTVVDWEKNFESDEVYFGLVEDNTIEVDGGDDIQMRGRLMYAKIKFDNGNMVFEDLKQIYTGTGSTAYPFSSEPLAAIDRFGKKWVFAGSGRFYVADDAAVESENVYVGLLIEKYEEDEDEDAYERGYIKAVGDDGRFLADVSNVLVSQDSQGGGFRFSGYDGFYTSEGDNPVTAGDLRAAITGTNGSNYRGWVRRLESESELISDRSVFASESVIVNSYDPLAVDDAISLDSCRDLGFGRSYTYAFDMYTGLPQLGLRRLNLGAVDDDGFSEVDIRLLSYGGYVAAPTIVSGAGVKYVPDGGGETTEESITDGLKALINEGKGEPGQVGLELDDLPGTRRSWREIGVESIDVSETVEEVIRETIDNLPPANGAN